jgi:serine/threonine protein kinase
MARREVATLQSLRYLLVNFLSVPVPFTHTLHLFPLSHENIVQLVCDAIWLKSPASMTCVPLEYATQGDLGSYLLSNIEFSKNVLFSFFLRFLLFTFYFCIIIRFSSVIFVDFDCVQMLVSMMAQVARALRFLHEKHILHRDLKPANVLVFDGPILKLTDFGYAKELSTASLLSSKLGSQFFIAPEVLLDSPYDRAADIFSFGTEPNSY